MANIKPEDIADALEEQLEVYHQEVTEKLNTLSEQAAKDLVKKTKATAPEGARKSFKRNITSKLTEKTNRGNTYTWHVKPPDHRLTHLLVHGHATRDGGRTKSNPFLQNALDEILPEYEAAVEEAIKE